MPLPLHSLLVVGDSLLKRNGHNMVNRWRNALIIRKAGNFLEAQYLKSRLQSLWKTKGEMEFMHIGFNNYIIFNLVEEDKKKILTAWPWKIGKDPHLVRTWIPNYSAQNEKGNTIIAIWMQILYLPIEYHNPKALIHIGNSIGKTVVLVVRNAKLLQAHTIRICIDQSKFSYTI